MTKKAPNPVVFFLLAGVALVGTAGILYMESNAIGGLRTQISALKADMKSEADVQKELESEQSRLAEMQARVRHLEKSVPDFRYIPTMLQELEGVGRREGIAVTGVRPLPPPPTKKQTPEEAKAERRKPYEVLSIEIKGRGKYGDALRFLDALNRFPKIVAARAVTIAPKVDPRNPDGPPELEVTVELRAYAFKEAPAKKDSKTAQAEGDNHAG